MLCQRTCRMMSHGAVWGSHLEGVGHSGVHIVDRGDRVPSLGPVEVGDGVASLGFVERKAGVCGGEGRCLCYMAGSGENREDNGERKAEIGVTISCN